MKMSVTFEDNNASFQMTAFSQYKTMQTGFGELTVVHDGQNGATFMPHISDDGILTWTNDRGLDNPEPVCIKGKDGEDGVAFETDATLTLEDGILSVNTAKEVEQDNTLPVTSAAVFAEVGNINALLETI